MSELFRKIVALLIRLVSTRYGVILSRPWWRARVRCIGRDTYIRFTPSFGFGVPWFPWKGLRRRLRYARHHGLQLVVWNNVGRWVVSKQVFGQSTVKGESALAGTAEERVKQRRAMGARRPRRSRRAF